MVIFDAFNPSRTLKPCQEHYVVFSEKEVEDLAVKVKKGLGFVHNGYEYRSPADAITLFSSPVKIVHFFTFMSEDLKSYIVDYKNGKLDILPIVLYKSERGGTEFLAVDYLYFVQTVARYLMYHFGDYGREFIGDFMIDAMGDRNAKNAIMLTHSYFSEVLRIAYINTVGPKTLAKFLRFSTKSIFKNDRAAVEFSAINFNLTRLIAHAGNEDLFYSLGEIGKVSGAEQVAFGKDAQTYFAENKLKQKFFMSSEQFNIMPKFD